MLFDLHAQFKNLEKQNLRDNMTPLELIFTALSEEATRLNAISIDAQGFEDNHDAALEGGKAAGEARERLEKTVGKVVSTKNFLDKNSDDILLNSPTNEQQ